MAGKLPPPAVVRKGALVRVAGRNDSVAAPAIALAFLDLRFDDGHTERWLGPGSTTDYNAGPGGMQRLQEHARMAAAEHASTILGELAMTHELPMRLSDVDDVPCEEVVVEWNQRMTWPSADGSGLSAVSDEYVDWMDAVEWDQQLLRPDPWPTFAFEDVAGYRAFPLDVGVRSEIKFALASSRPPADREREFLRHIRGHLSTRLNRRIDRDEAPLALFALRLNVDAFSMSLRARPRPMGAPRVTAEDLHYRALADINARLRRLE